MSNTPDDTKELPPAFTEPVTEPVGEEIYDNDPTSSRESTSTGLDRVEEGSAESFPGSDVPSTSPPTTIADRPVDPTA
jgi:hypothetical protein